MIFLGILSLGGSGHTHALEAPQRVIPVRGASSIHLFNHRGSISVKGVSGEQVRLSITERVAMGPSPLGTEATQAARAAQVLVDQRGDVLSIGLSYLSTLTLEERLKERKLNLSEFDLEVEVPNGKTLELFSSGKEIRVDRWSGGLSVRAESASVVLTRTDGNIQVSCRGCGVVLSEIKGALAVSGVARGSRVEQVSVSDFAWSSFTGDVTMRAIKAKTAVISLVEGNFSIQGVEGGLIVDSERAPVDIRALRGSASIRVSDGNVHLGVDRWRDPGSLSVIESARGNISLEIGPQNHFLLEVWSRSSAPDVRLPNRVRLDETGEVGPQPVGRMRLQVGRGGSELLVRAGRGDIRVLPAP